MATAAFIVSIVALLAAGASAVYTRTQAQAATNADLRARRPILNLSLDKLASSGETTALFYIENQGSEDLDSVVISRPITADGVRYPVAKLGQEFEDQVDLGRLEIKEKQGVVLCIGSAEQLPEFRLRIQCRVGNARWDDAHVLEDPRFRIGVY